MKNGLVSILVVSYNAEKYIEKTLQSCLLQTYSDFEILVLDNASSDRTVRVIKNFVDSSIILFENKENVGPYAGLNFLLDQARGEYIAIQDHDDIWFPEKIAKQVEFLENNKDFIACGTNTFYFYEGKNVLILNEKTFYTDFVDHTSLVFRNESFRYTETHHFADDHFEKKILLRNGKIACIQEGLTVHRIKSDGSNFSSHRFKLSFVQLYDFFDVFGFHVTSFMTLVDIFIGKYLSDRFIWFIRRNITQSKKKWVALQKFQKEHSKLSL